ncbi:MFS transporter [Candidatus Fermentibacterales bacterium]|nr:MFS transporter [Candidatus Fermentibacterales bacterium]
MRRRVRIFCGVRSGDDTTAPRKGDPVLKPRHDPYKVLALPGFRSLVLGNLLVHVGTSAQSLAIGWEMYTRTNEALALGLIGLMQALPMFLLTLPAGYLADVFDRRKVMIAGMAGATATSAGLALFSMMRGQVEWMYALLFLDAAFQRLAGPARQALLPLVVPSGQFEAAVKWRSTLTHLSAVAGPAIGGMIISRSLPAAYLFCAATSLCYIVLLARLRVRDARRTERGDMLRQVAEGLRFVWRRSTILGCISLDMFAVLLGGAVYLLPIFARDIIEGAPPGLGPEQVLGWLRAAPAAGAIVMALLLAHLPPMRRAGRTLLSCVAAFGLATIVFGISRSFWLSLAALFLTGFFDNVSIVIRHTLVQLRTPNEMRGRVSAVNSIFIGSSNELGGFESGLVAHFAGPVLSVVSGGIGTLLVVGAWTRLFPGLRSIGPLDEEGAGGQEQPAPSRPGEASRSPDSKPGETG